MNDKNKSKEELIAEIEELKNFNNSLQEKYNEVIIKQKEVEESLRISENSRFHKIVENAPIAMAIVSLDGVIEFINNKAIKVFGYNHEDIPNMDRWWVQAYPDEKYREEVVADWMGRIQRALIEGIEIIGNEYRTTCKDGSKRTVFISGVPVSDKVFVLFDDITERKKAEEALIQNEEKFRKAFHTNPDSININRMDDGMFISINKGFTQILGFTEEDAIGKTSFELNIWNDINDRNRLVEGLKNKGHVENLEAKFCAKNGTLVDGLMSAAIIDLEGVPHIISITRDITERKQYEFLLKEKSEEIKSQNEKYLQMNEELNKINSHLTFEKERAEESDRLKTAFLQNMSHEIRTPMNAICGFSDLLIHSDLNVEERNNYINIIQNSSTQLLSIITDILTISAIDTKQEKTNNSKVCLNNIIAELFSIYSQTAINKNIELTTRVQFEDKQSEVLTDKTKVTQILTNLINNAFKFTHDGNIEFGYTLKEQELEFFVEDNGIGIKPEFQEQIFERFRQADLLISKKYGGTGLGLAISKGLVELLGGRIWVNSEVDKGSTFYFTIPYNPTTIA